MTLLQRMLIIWALASAMALLVLVGQPTSRSRTTTSAIQICIIVMASALLVVGVVSDTVLIHVVQILPLVATVIALRGKPDWSSIAAAPLFAFWLLIMGGIWFFLLGVSRFFTGRFTTTEIVLTIVIGVASVIGLASSYRQRVPTSVSGRLITVGAIAGLQALAVWLSYHPFW